MADHVEQIGRTPRIEELRARPRCGAPRPCSARGRTRPQATRRERISARPKGDDHEPFPRRRLFVRRRSLPPDVRAAVRQLLSLPELPAPDGKRLRHQRSDRGRPGRAPRGRAATRSTCRATRATTRPSGVVRPARSPSTAATRASRSASFAPERSTTRLPSPPTLTSTRARSCHGSRFPNRCPRSRSTTTRRAVAGGERRAARDAQSVLLAHVADHDELELGGVSRLALDLGDALAADDRRRYAGILELAGNGCCHPLPEVGPCIRSRHDADRERSSRS